MEMKKFMYLLIIVVAVTSLVFLGIGCKEEAVEEVQEAVEEAVEEVEEAVEEMVDEADLPVLNIGMSVNIGAVANNYMIENGIDKENGFIINQIIFPTGVAINEGIAANEVDMATTGSGGLFAINNLDVEWITDFQLQSNGIGIFVRGDSPIATVKGVNPDYPEVYGDPDTVRGATILATFGTIGEFQVLKWLGIIGVDPSEVSITQMQYPDVFTAMQAEQADVGNLIPTASYAAPEMGWVEVGSMASLDIAFYDGFLLNVNTVNDSNGADKREGLIKYLKVLYEDITPMFNNTEGMKAEWSKKFFDSQAIETNPDWLDFQASTWTYWAADDYTSGEHILGEWLRPFVEFYVTAEKLPADFMDTFDASLNDEYLKEALGY
ncbi:ABC transporter substrate-binding protein [Actinomycetota bacterium]